MNDKNLDNLSKSTDLLNDGEKTKIEINLVKEQENDEEIKVLEAQNYQMEYGKIINPWYCDKKMKVKKDKKFTPFQMGFSDLVRMLIPCCQNTKIKNDKKIYEDCGLYIESFFDIQRIVGILSEYQELRTVVLSSEEYKILKLLTTPKIEINGEDINLRKSERFTVTKDMNQNFIDFKYAINKLVRTKHLSGIEYSLLDLHKLDLKNELPKE